MRAFAARVENQFRVAKEATGQTLSSVEGRAYGTPDTDGGGEQAKRDKAYEAQVSTINGLVIAAQTRARQLGAARPRRVAGAGVAWRGWGGRRPLC